MKHCSVLVVEDDKWLAEQYERVLSRAGFRTTIAPHALAAIHAIDETHPDAIILDVLLTGSTAFTLLHELQSYDDSGAIPIIICTNLASDLKLKDFQPYGVKCILDKTKMVPDDMVVALKSVLL
jgi:two-component system OmpR family response regulator